MKIGITGAGGVGKSSLAEAVAKALNIPLLKSKSITHMILNRDGYDYSSGVQIERFLANTGRQNEILRLTLEQQNVPAFVTDRTVVDLAAYALCEMRENSDTVKHIIDTCRKNITNYTHLFMCPWQDSPLTDNGKRTLNPWYQFMIHVVERGIMDDWGCKYYIVPVMDNEQRVECVLNLLHQ